MKRKQPKVVAIIDEVSQAIDFTPIYRIRVLKTLRPGQMLEWDKAEKNLILVENVAN